MASGKAGPGVTAAGHEPARLGAKGGVAIIAGSASVVARKRTHSEGALAGGDRASADCYTVGAVGGRPRRAGAAASDGNTVSPLGAGKCANAGGGDGKIVGPRVGAHRGCET